jgi:hypothetical protein
MKKTKRKHRKGSFRPSSKQVKDKAEKEISKCQFVTHIMPWETNPVGPNREFYDPTAELEESGDLFTKCSMSDTKAITLGESSFVILRTSMKFTDRECTCKFYGQVVYIFNRLQPEVPVKTILVQTQRSKPTDEDWSLPSVIFVQNKMLYYKREFVKSKQISSSLNLYCYDFETG